MNRLIIIFACFIFTACSTDSNSVVICTGPQSKAYHTISNQDECYGVNACSADLKTISKQEALDKGRHPCRFCY